jgi:hypothetical protein
MGEAMKVCAHCQMLAPPPVAFECELQACPHAFDLEVSLAELQRREAKPRKPRPSGLAKSGSAARDAALKRWAKWRAEHAWAR